MYERMKTRQRKSRLVTPSPKNQHRLGRHTRWVHSSSWSIRTSSESTKGTKRVWMKTTMMMMMKWRMKCRNSIIYDSIAIRLLVSKFAFPNRVIDMRQSNQLVLFAVGTSNRSYSVCMHTSPVVRQYENISVSIICSSLIVVLSEWRSSSISSCASEVDWDDEKFEHRKLKLLNRTRRRFLPMNIESGDLRNGVIKVRWWWICNRYAFCRIECVHRRAPAVLTSIRWQSTDRLTSMRLVDWVIIYNHSKKWFYFLCSIITYSISLIWHRHEVSFSMDHLVSFS